MKLCFKCREMKPLSEFYRHKMMRDGHLNKCKPCTKKDANTNRDARREYYRDYDRRRYLNPERKQMHREHAEDWRLRNMVGHNAQGKLRREIRWGRINRQPCVVCGREDSHGHHNDYSRPLDVMWLCPVHHAEQHKREGKMNPGEKWSPNDTTGTGTKTFGRKPKSRPF